MHEFSLYGQIPSTEHGRMRQQLVGVTRMQPKPIHEIHLVFKSQIPLGLQAGTAGRASNDKQQETQRVMRLLSSGLYYVHVVGMIQTENESHSDAKAPNGDVEMGNGNVPKSTDQAQMAWRLEFKDTPEAGKQTLSSRYVAKIPIDDGDVLKFMKNLGYDYFSRFMMIGDKFFDRDTTISLHRAMRVPDANTNEDPTDCSFLDRPEDINPLDGSGGYLLETSIQAVDGNNQELKDRAVAQLLNLKETLKQAVTLTPGDRLSLDTKLPVVNRGN